ncbi:uncharacterized protein LOC118754304 [Rhagoletis pomonella]|uniref:uncharacterized protein LOC118754304 n=1 Tax=Rhagoletis pomonella TaxID=28610 RepID=UPI00177D148E|nr:uncharacterized protein LOC118754304 [Rhagoletis pomonella]
MPDAIPTAAIYAHPCSELEWKPEPPSEIRRARRFKGPIYATLLKEFYQDGCFKGACHFEYLVELEQSLIEKEHEIHYVYENESFLFQLVDNAKAAEQVFYLDRIRGLNVSRKILYQLIELVEKQQFHWLTQKLYEIIAEYMLKPKTNDGSAQEQSARFIFKYAKFLMQQGKPEQLQKATMLIPTAMEAACSEEWQPDTSPENELFCTLHAALGNLLAKIYLIKAKQADITRKRAIKRVQKALKAIAQVGIQENRCTAFKVFLTKTELLMESGRYDWALKELLLLEKSVMKAEGPEFKELKLDFFKKLGTTLCSLGNPIDAIEIFGKALKFCRVNNFPQAEGDILLQIGHAQRHLPGGELRALLAFQLAERRFHCQGDKSKELSTIFVKAALKSQLILSDLTKLMSSKAYCDYYKLRRWKNLCEPFWEVETQTGHINRNILKNISMYTSENLHKLYNLVLETSEKDDCEENVYLERIIVENLYKPAVSMANAEVEIEEGPAGEEGLSEYEFEYDQVSANSDLWDIEQSDTSQKVTYAPATAQVRKYSISATSRKSTPTVKDTDPISCLLRET